MIWHGTEAGKTCGTYCGRRYDGLTDDDGVTMHDREVTCDHCLEVMEDGDGPSIVILNGDSAEYLYLRDPAESREAWATTLEEMPEGVIMWLMEDDKVASMWPGQRLEA